MVKRGENDQRQHNQPKISQSVEQTFGRIRGALDNLKPGDGPARFWQEMDRLEREEKESKIRNLADAKLPGDKEDRFVGSKAQFDWLSG